MAYISTDEAAITITRLLMFTSLCIFETNFEKKVLLDTAGIDFFFH